MKRSPLVSIIVPAYNNEDTLEDCLLSLIKQTHPVKEIIVIYDEGSTDNTGFILSKMMEDFPLIQFISTSHVSRSEARNLGWKNSAGEILFFADADDMYNEDYLDKAVSCLLSNPRFGGVTVTGASYTERSTFTAKCMEVYSKIKRRLVDEGKFTHSWAWVYRREAIEAVGGFDERLNQAEDKDLYLRVKEKGYLIDLVKGVNWFHRRRVNFFEYTKMCYLGGKRRTLFVLKHKTMNEFIKSVAAFWIVCLALIASIRVPFLIFLVLSGIVLLLAYKLFITLKLGWDRVERKKYLFIFPFFNTFTYIATAIGYTHGFMMVCLEKLTGRRIDWSRV